MSSENIVSKKFRILVDKSQRLYERISFWTRASDVEFNSGKNAQDTLGNIYGISDSLTSTSSNIAASTAAVKAINDKVTNVALGDATQADVLAPKTFSSSAGINKTGTMSNLSGAVGYSSVADGNTFARIVLGNTGKITQGTSYVDVPCSTLKSNVKALNSSTGVNRVWARIDSNDSVSNFLTVGNNHDNIIFIPCGAANFTNGCVRLDIYGANTFDDSQGHGWYGNPCTDGVLLQSINFNHRQQYQVNVSGYKYVYFSATNNNNSYVLVELRNIGFSDN